MYLLFKLFNTINDLFVERVRYNKQDQIIPVSLFIIISPLLPFIVTS